MESSSLIQRLPLEVVHAIAAGEVIDSLAAVVRELVDNSLDAGATRIHGSLWPDRWQVRITDNGRGMTLGDLEAAAHPHSTSKIRDSADLWRISSLGFRGEALHSLAQLGQLEICSRSAQDPQAQGWRKGYGRAMVDLGAGGAEPLAMAPGTVVTVSELFAQWPARRQALPSAAQQLRLIQRLIHVMALCHPGVTWQMEHSDRPWFNLRPGATAQDILPQILREVQPTDLQCLTLTVNPPDPDPAPGSVDGPSASLQILAGLPDRCHRRRPDWIKVAVNGRLVQMPELEQTVLGSFRRTLPRDRFPICFVHLHLTPDHIDWNRNPAKTEIYLRHLDFWQGQIRAAIDQVLRLNPQALPQEGQNQRLGQVLKVAETAGGYGVQRQVSLAVEGSAEGSAAGSAAGSADTGGGMVRAIAQLHQMYIVAEHPAGIWLVEQHIAHERVLFEQIQDRWERVPLDPPLILSHLTPPQVEQLQRLELEVDPFGENLWAVRSAPALVAQRADCGEALLELSQGGDLAAAQAAIACRSAIRNGQVLTLPAMQRLLDQWQQTRHPRTCPHGRPICLTLEETSLSRFFRRHWVIGKSHGI